MTNPVEKLRQMTGRQKAKHRADVAWIQEHHPDVAEFLTDVVKCFGRCDYRVSIKRGLQK